MLSFGSRAGKVDQFVRSLWQGLRQPLIRRRRKLTTVECLEDRTLLSTFTVTNTSDDVNTTGSLRNVVNLANITRART